MVRFPEFMSGRHERREIKDKERRMSMRGWRQEMAGPKRDFASLRHVPAGMGRHLVRSEIARGRGQTKFKG